MVKKDIRVCTCFRRAIFFLVLLHFGSFGIKTFSITSSHPHTTWRVNSKSKTSVTLWWFTWHPVLIFLAAKKKISLYSQVIAKINKEKKNARHSNFQAFAWTVAKTTASASWVVGKTCCSWHAAISYTFFFSFAREQDSKNKIKIKNILYLNEKIYK